MKRLLSILLLTVACQRAETPPSQQTSSSGGDADRGRQLIAQYGCNACHTIPGTQGLQGRLGPSLAGLASRPAISNGVVPNTPDNLRRFILGPQSLNPQSSMPPIAIADADAHDIVAFLMTLK